MKNEERTLKISLERARKIWKERSDGVEGNEISASLNAIHGLLLENFTREELEGSKGYTWEESFSKEGYYINNNSGIMECNSILPDEVTKNIFKTEKQALSALAFAQLSHIVAYANSKSGPPETDRRNLMILYQISAYNNGDIKVESCNPTSIVLPIKPFYFNKKEDAENSLIVNKELWKQFYAGYGL